MVSFCFLISAKADLPALEVYKTHCKFTMPILATSAAYAEITKHMLVKVVVIKVILATFILTLPPKIG
jgi:hypothetical protein